MTDHETLQPRGAGLLPVLPPFAVPSCGAGACSSQSPSFAPCAAVRVAHSAGVRCTRYSPLSVTAPGCLVLYPGWSVALSAAGLVFGRGWLPGLLVRVGAGCWSGLVAGLVGSRWGWLLVGAGCRVGRCSKGRISTKYPISTVGLASFAQLHAHKGY